MKNSSNQLGDYQQEIIKYRNKNIGNLIRSLKSEKFYCYCRDLAKNNIVLDFGCGPGYGTAILGQKAKEVVGVDIFKDAIQYAKNNFSFDNISFKLLKSVKLPFDNNSFDLVVSSHVIEHIEHPKLYLKEYNRVLKENGILIIATPNRKKRLLPFQKPFDEDHFREYSSKTLKYELIPFFKNLKLLGIYGTEMINKIEKARLKNMKNPLIAYIYNPIISIMKRILPNLVNRAMINIETRFFKRVKSTNLTLSTDKRVKNRFGLEDIYVGCNLKESIDLVAICEKRII